MPVLKVFNTEGWNERDLSGRNFVVDVWLTHTPLPPSRTTHPLIPYTRHTPTTSHAHTPLQIQLVLWTGRVDVDALPSRAEEGEIVENPIQCLVHPFKQNGEKSFFFFLSLSTSAASSLRKAAHRHTTLTWVPPQTPSKDLHLNYILY